MKIQLISQAQYARNRGVSAPYICQLVKEGVILLTEGKVDPVQADKAIEAWGARIHDTPGKQGTNEGGEDSIASHRKRQIAVVTALKQLQLDEEKGKVINAEELKIGLCQLFSEIKTTLRSIPSKTSGEIYYLSRNAKTDREGMAAVSTLLLREIDESLTALAGWRYKSNKKGGGKGKKIGPYKRR